MVVVDKLRKTAHFIPVKFTYKAVEIANIFMREIFQLHGIPQVVISDRDVKFTSAFWKTLFVGLGTQIHFSTSYYPQTDGQIERVNQVLEDMLRMFVMQQPQKWEDHLHLLEFSYNNGHHESLGMSPFEVIYGRKGQVPTDWNSQNNKLALGPDILEEMEATIKKVHQNLKVAEDRQKVYADKKRTHKEFHLGDHMYLRVKPRKRTLQWKGCAKLPRWYCGWIGPVEYKLALLGHIRVHNVFHVEPEGEFLVEPLHILNQRETTLRRQAIIQVKVQWKNFGSDEATWEEEEVERKYYPAPFT
eukprot:PITA_16219